MIRHILLITFIDEVPLETIRQIRDAFLHIPQLVEGVESVEWGINNSPEDKNAGYTHCVLMTFLDEKARQHYLPHPSHEALQSILLPVLNNIIVLDYSRPPNELST
ncbi:TPA: Dabb family protein [Serratia marcescens]|uniref:Dabb family protein n=1 Tax=Serratia TaxID=613 RepID=UPI000908157B|nr:MULTISPECIES: Dabb family protein [Serratia]MBH2927915.1 Dabb family protein [Serratia ureilytica]